jgi:hypothetical protein
MKKGPAPKKSLPKKIINLVKNEVKKTPLGRHPGATLGRFAQNTLKVPFAAPAGAIIGRIAGTGDYRVGAGISFGRDSRGVQIPQFSGSGRQTVVTHREYLGDIVASSTAGAFKNQVIALNPGLSSSFPWLAGLAMNFDQWEPLGMLVEYVNQSSTYSGTASLGSITLACEYDVANPAYLSKFEMNNAEYAVSSNVAENLMMAVECKKSQRAQSLYYTRSSGVGLTDNIRFYDLANLQVATYGCAASQVVGELWITYKIRFMKEQIWGGLLGRNLINCQYTVADASIVGTTPFGTVAPTVLTGYSPYSNIFPITAGNVLTFPAWMRGATLQLTMWWTGQTAAYCSAGTLTFSGPILRGPNIFNANNSETSDGSTQSKSFTWVQTLSLNGTGSGDMAVTVGAMLLPSTSPSFGMSIVQLPPAT